MITVEALFGAASEMKAASDLAARLRDQLASVVSSAAYGRWWSGGLAEREPFRFENPDEYPLLSALGFANDGALRVKINALRDRIFVTDGIWVARPVRVFPFADESATLLRHVDDQGLGAWATAAVDLAAGCGHNAVAVAGPATRVALDVSPRALAFAEVNRILNGIPGQGFVAALNDIRDGVPGVLRGGQGDRVLFLANMPFGPAPRPGILPPTSHGGEAGIDLQIATLDAIRDFAGRSGAVRASLLGLTVGSRAEDRWEMVDEARARFGPDHVRWTLVPDKVFRISGRREQDNPAPVATALPRIAECGLYVADDERDALRAAYRDLAGRLERKGNPDIAYGVVDIAVG